MSELGKITPEMLLRSVGFQSTSGNRVTKVSLLGESGFYCAWLAPPTRTDSEEFKRWFENQYKEMEAHNQVDPDKHAAKAAYQKWLKNARH
jgi:hypothetical protein